MRPLDRATTICLMPMPWRTLGAASALQKRIAELRRIDGRGAATRADYRDVSRGNSIPVASGSSRVTYESAHANHFASSAFVAASSSDAIDV